jgi:aldose 1-epimerase
MMFEIKPAVFWLRKFTALLLAAGAGSMSLSTLAASLSEAAYGITGSGQPVTQYTLTSARGVTMKFIDYGGVITELDTPDRNGKRGNIVLGFASLKDYEQFNANIHFGSLIGRYANRIAGGRFNLDDHTYQLPINNGPNTLHGGPNSFDTKIWTVRTFKDENSVSAELKYVSPDGENGFPGTLTTYVTYTVTDSNEVRIDYRATTDKTTVVNLTNHSYFNLAGEGSGNVERQVIQIAASLYTPTDATSIPTGELSSVTGTPMDFRQPKPIGTSLRSPFQQLLWAHGYDSNWVLDNGGRTEPGFAARVYDPSSGRVLEMYTTNPGLQFYTANGLDGSVIGTSGKTYRQTDAFALEAEHFPDSPNQPSFPTTELKPGRTLHEVTVWRFNVR